MRKRNKKLLLCVSTLLALTFSTEAYAQTKPADIPYTPPTTAQSATSSESDEYIAYPFRDILGWRYKAVDGKMYRRQYNYSKQKWVGEWELC
ncbi:hypothetical protein [Lacrimispora sp. JR3]|uniref:hypothetical protein n=1 Tax=Lacrimispora sinapis TaxID=3111456 RepID=UPI00374A796F